MTKGLENALEILAYCVVGYLAIGLIIMAVIAIRLRK